MVVQYQYISIHEILSRILRHPLLQDLTLESAIQYTIDFFGLMGLPSTYIDKIEEVDIINYRGKLPCDLIYINQVRTSDKKHYLRSMTDNFNGSEDNSRREETFKTQGNIIFTSFKEGKIEISYKAIATDDEGMPLLPNEPTFLRALELYIKMQWFTILFDMGKIQLPVLHNTQQQYYIAAGACNNTYLIPSTSEMESISNMLNQLVPKVNEFNKGFKSLGDREYLKL